MEQHARYEIIEKIGEGDFAAVFRARDKELGREIAIKQIHQQYLDDPQQLDRYWREAQLIATLDHPHIMTIYDVVREQGWLILELMQGSLKQLLGGRPIDLKDLRLALKYTLSALQCLEQNGIVHGDVKPGNLLVDRNHRVKLGDFGIARRIAGDEGSVVKGTTKYMAPEVVSDQFGEVGPHSDLYSLGFSAFDLMCGQNFETLFPGLNMFGRDRQIAWMMWHSAPDRRLPEIQRVLQGVPDDLAFIVQKLTEKDPAKRYRTAEEVLADLRSGGQPGQAAAAEEEQAKAEEEAKKAQRKRRLTFAALGASVLLTLCMLFIPRGGDKPVAPVGPARPTEGAIVEVDLERSRFFLAAPEGAPQGVDVNPDADRILLNDAPARLEDLKQGDKVEIKYLAGEEGGKLIEVTRPIAIEQAGTIEGVNAGAGVISFLPGGERNPIDINVPASAAITLNRQSTIDGRKLELSDLRPKDRLTVQHAPSEDGRVAILLNAQRLVQFSGSLVSVDTVKRTLTVRVGQGQNAVEKQLPVSTDCQITLNKVDKLDGKVLNLGDLKAADNVTVEHDAEVRRIEAERQFVAAGSVRRVEYAERRFWAMLDGKPGQTQFTLASDCRFTILANGKTVDFAYLRNDDRVEVTHDSTDLKDVRALAVSVDAKPDRRAWAVVIGQQQYDDKRVSPVPCTAADAQLLREVLENQYRVAANQLLVLRDATKTRLQQDVARFFQTVQDANQLIVFFSGHAYIDDTKAPFLAPKEIDIGQIAKTGLSLRWLVSEMEAVGAGEKILLLDACHGGDGKDLQSEPSSAELVELLKENPNRAPSTSVTIIASCQQKQRGLILQDQGHGLFAYYAAAAFEGQADDNRDHRVNSDELMRFLESNMAGHRGPRSQQQTAKRFLPDAKPPRLSQEAIAAAGKLLDRLQSSRIDDAFAAEFEAAQSLAPTQPDLELAYAVVQLKHSRTAESLRAFESARRRSPDLQLPYHAIAWQQFMKGEQYERVKGVDDLVKLVERIPPPRSDQQLTPYEAHVLEFAGNLRKFASDAADPPLPADALNKLDEAVGQRGEEAKKHYQAGIDAVGKAIAAIDRKIESARTPTEQNKFNLERKRLTYYTKFDFEAAEKYLRELLKK